MGALCVLGTVLGPGELGPSSMQVPSCPAGRLAGLRPLRGSVQVPGGSGAVLLLPPDTRELMLFKECSPRLLS